MNTGTRILALASSILLISSTGCIHTSSTRYRDADQVGVRFENDEADRLFHDGIAGRRIKPVAESTTDISLPLVFSHRSRVVGGNHSVFNKAAALCDVNCDGLITEAEARRFAASRVSRK